MKTAKKFITGDRFSIGDWSNVIPIQETPSAIDEVPILSLEREGGLTSSVLLAIYREWIGKNIGARFASSEPYEAVNLALHRTSSPYDLTFVHMPEEGASSIQGFRVSLTPKANAKVEVLQIPEEEGLDHESAANFIAAQRESGMSVPNADEMKRLETMMADFYQALQSENIQYLDISGLVNEK